MRKRLYIINGPNLNLLGIRNPELYGYKTLEAINLEIAEKANEIECSCVFLQSNHEGSVVDYIQEARTNAYGLIINPGAYGHYSYAIRDAIECLTIPCIEVHLTDISKREDFRHHSVISDVCTDTIMGKLELGYLEAIDKIKEFYEKLDQQI